MSLTFAEQLLQGYGITQPEDIDVEAIAFDQGAIVKYRPMSTCEARIIGHGDSAVISINNRSLPERQRFSLGHELGHWTQDKGMVSLSCVRSDIGPQRAGIGNPESQANAFATQLLMPDYIFKPISAQLPLTFETVRQLGKRFGTSLTATAIKLVKTAHFPGMVACYKDGRLHWAVPGPDVPRALQPVRALDEDSRAYELWKGGQSVSAKPQLQSADTWIDCLSAEDYSLIEDSILVSPGVTVSLLWWKDEAQIREGERGDSAKL